MGRGNYFNDSLFYAKEKPKSFSEIGNFRLKGLIMAL